MTVHFIGVGPGAEDLITIRARALIKKSPICLYAGSLISENILKFCPEKAKIKSTAYMNLDQILDEFKKASNKKLDVARLHSGDLSIWSAVGEQIRLLKNESIPYTITPGVPSFSAASAAIEKELTLPGISQSLVLTRIGGRATPVPESERIDFMAKTGATIAFHLSIKDLNLIVKKLIPFYGNDCPIYVLYKVSHPDEKIFYGRLKDIETIVPKTIKRTALILVGRVLKAENFDNSRLYAKNYKTRFRK